MGAEFVVDRAFAYFGDHDFTGDIHTWSLDGGSDVRQRTTFRNTGSHRFSMGLFTNTMTMAGYADFAEGGSDASLWTPHAARASRVTTVGNIEAEGQPCCMTQQLIAAFTPGGGVPVGEMSAFTMSGAGSDRYGAIRGTLMVEQATVTATGAIGTEVELGAVDADERLFATLHLLGTAGTSITVVLESDADDTFGSATTRGTFGPLTAVGGNWLTPVAGAIADTWWRFRVTAITGTWTVAAAAGIE